MGVEIVLPVPGYVNFDSPKPWNGKVIAPVKFREYLIATLYRIAGRAGLQAQCEGLTAHTTAYQASTASNRRIADSDAGLYNECRWASTEATMDKFEGITTFHDGLAVSDYVNMIPLGETCIDRIGETHQARLSRRTRKSVDGSLTPRSAFVCSGRRHIHTTLRQRAGTTTRVR